MNYKITEKEFDDQLQSSVTEILYNLSTDSADNLLFKGKQVGTSGTSNGLMSKDDKIKLDGIETGANKTVLNNTVTSTSTTEAATANAVKTAYDKANHSHPYASTSVVSTTSNGLMSKDDKIKLDGIRNYTHPEKHPASMISGLHKVATSGRYDDLVGIPSSFPPEKHSHDYLPSNGGIVTGNLGVTGTCNFKNVGIDNKLYIKVNNVATDIGLLLNDLKSTVVNGKQSVANAINGKLGTSLSSQTSFADMAYYINQLSSLNVTIEGLLKYIFKSDYLLVKDKYIYVDNGTLKLEDMPSYDASCGPINPSSVSIHTNTITFPAGTMGAVILRGANWKNYDHISTKLTNCTTHKLFMYDCKDFGISPNGIFQALRWVIPIDSTKPFSVFQSLHGEAVDGYTLTVLRGYGFNERYISRLMQR